MSAELLVPVQLDRAPEEERPTEWLWYGYLGRGAVTLLTSLWKTGKTTLLSVLLSRMQLGGLFAELPLMAGRIAVVTEEPLRFWRERSQRLSLGRHVYFFPRPFRSLPTTAEWHGLIESIDQLRQRERIDLAVIDPLAMFLPRRTELHRDFMIEALMPLQRLTDAGMAVLLLHHPRKGDPPLGQAARGTGSLTGFVDIGVEMRMIGHPNKTDRRRRLQAQSRFEATPEDLVIELTADGTDYLAHGDLADEELRGHWPTLAGVLEQADSKLTRSQILDRWPMLEDKPSEVTLWRWLEWGVAQGRLAREGKGTHVSPFRYWLAGREVIRGELPPISDDLDDLFPERLGPRKPS